MVKLIAVAAFCLIVGMETQRPKVSSTRPRILVLTDISSLTPGVREPDDGQSMIRLMLYTNDLEVEGLIATSNMVHGHLTRPELIRQIVNTYGRVRPNLLLHDRRYPTEKYLLDRIKSGQPNAGKEVPVEECVGDGKDTNGSDWIIHAADRRDSRPLWITVWGGTTDLAQALWKVRKTRSPKERDAFISRLRIIAINDQDSTGPWIRREFPKLWYELRTFSYRGMYRNGDITLVSSEWVEQKLKKGNGPLAALYPNYNGGDIWSNKLGPVRGVKEGDTPSFLSLIPNGLNDPDHPERPGWGGQCQPEPDNPRRFVDAVDSSTASPTDPAPSMSTVYRWRKDFQDDFVARMGWCVRPESAGTRK